MSTTSIVIEVGLPDLAAALLDLPEDPKPVLIMTRWAWKAFRSAWPVAMQMADASNPAAESPEAMLKEKGIAIFLADGDAQFDHCLQIVISKTPNNPIVRVS